MTTLCGIFSLEGKVIIVTGGTRKYGHIFCDALTEAGATVIVTSREQERADATAAEFANKGRKCFGYQLEQADDDSIETLVRDVIRDHGHIDVLVNNARHVPQMPPAEINREELDKLFTINSVGLILLTRCVVEEMKKANGGNIINIGSMYGMVGQDLSIYDDPDSNWSWDYPIQKGGVITYTRQLATCLARYNIRSNCLSLGGLREAHHAPAFLETYGRRVPLGRMAVPDDAKGPIIFLASDASAYMTGANLVVDGGWTAW